MKIALLSVCIAVSIAACKRSTPEHSSLVGKWKLTATLADPGDGSGKWQTVSPLTPSYVEFKGDGTLSYTPSSQNGGGRYLLTSDSTFTLITDTDSLREFYRIQGATLTITPPCYEPCGERYASVN